MANPPILESLAFDPVLGKMKLIAEAWDAGGLYQVGSYPSWNRWAEWNGRYRDDMRSFLKEMCIRDRVIIISDTFSQFAGPLMKKLGWPTIFCNELEVAEDGEITGFRMRRCV